MKYISPPPSPSNNPYHPQCIAAKKREHRFLLQILGKLSALNILSEVASFSLCLVGCLKSFQILLMLLLPLEFKMPTLPIISPFHQKGSN